MALNYKLTTEARQELDEALTWYRQRQEGLEAQFFDEFRKLIARIRDNPNQFPEAYKRSRKAVFPKPFRFYTIYFQVQEDTAVILAVFHGRRKAKEWKGRVQ